MTNENGETTQETLHEITLADLQDAIVRMDAVVHSHNEMFKTIMNMLGIGMGKGEVEGQVNFMLKIPKNPKDNPQAGFIAKLFIEIQELKKKIGDGRKIILP